MTILDGKQVPNVAFTPEHRETPIAFGRTPVWQAVGGFVTLGIEHILTGYDHMLFLLSLLMAGRRPALAHQDRHGVHGGALGDAVPGRPWRRRAAVALGGERHRAEHRLRSHGERLARKRVVGLAGGPSRPAPALCTGWDSPQPLQEMHLPQANIAASLVGFNVGVEIGQVTVVLPGYLALDVVRNRTWPPTFRQWVAVATALVGAFWFIRRAMFT